MDEILTHAELFQGLTRDALRRLSAVGRARQLAAGDYLFLLGDGAEYLYIVTRGKIDLCLPMPLGGVVKDIPVEPAGPGKALGWSALVRPYRFTLSARATEPTEVVGFRRQDLLQIFEAAPREGNRFLTNLSELVGFRLLAFQALWVRELQRTLLTETQRRPGTG